MRKVSEKEIEKLYGFTRKHFVEYYDLQTELVDHLANGMESRWEENPHLNFEENLQLEFKKFGVFGFSEVVEKRQNSLFKKYWLLLWRETYSALAQPKILFFTLLFIGGATFLMRYEIGSKIMYWGYVLCLTIELIYLFRTGFWYQRRKKHAEKIFLLEEIIMTFGGTNMLFFLPLYLMNIAPNHDFSATQLYISLGFATFTALMVLMGYVAMHILPKKKDEILKKAYPGMKIAP